MKKLLQKEIRKETVYGKWCNYSMKETDLTKEEVDEMLLYNILVHKFVECAFNVITYSQYKQIMKIFKEEVNKVKISGNIEELCNEEE